VATICRSLESDFEFSVLHGVRSETPVDLGGEFSSNVELIRWKVGRSVNVLSDLRAVRELSNVARRTRPDIIHAHSSKAGALVRLARLEDRNARVYSPRGYSFRRQDISAAGRLFYRMVEKALGKLPHVTVACGLGEYGDALTCARSAVMIPNMVEVGEFFRDQQDVAPEGPLIVCMIGSARKQKNFELFCELAQRCRERDMRFVWVGPADTRAMSGAALVEVTGLVPREEVVRRLAQADVYVQTSLWEGLSIAVLEAMAAALPVLAYPCVGNSELVVEGENGFKCTTSPQFVEKLAYYREYPEVRKRHGAYSRKLVSSQNSVEINAPRWRSLYSELCGVRS
jgi:glycosyltransferase involved in cell wall biosynthesis